MDDPGRFDDPAGSRWPRLFTVAEANALLPEVTTALLGLRAARSTLGDARAAASRITPSMRGNGSAARAAEMDARIDALRGDVAVWTRRLAATGIELRDIDDGLVDFPSLRDGRVVFLCWRLGEDRVRYWHDIDAGFAGRQPLD